MIAVTADIHAANHKPFSTILPDGRNSRLVAIIDAVLWCANDAVERGCKFFCIAGDLFHNRKSIEVSVLSEVSGLVDKLSGMFEQVYVLVGNHDESLSRKEHSVGAFRRTNVHVIDKPTWHKLGKQRVGFLPWTPTRAAFTKRFTKLLKRMKREADGCDGVITHIGLDKAWAGPVDWEVEGDIEIPDIFKGKQKWVLMGHFHKAQSWEEGKRLIAYVGSPLQHSYAEQDERKGYWVVPDKGVPFMVYNDDAPRFVTVSKKAEAQKVRPQDYVKTVGKKADALKTRIAKKNPNVIALPEVQVVTERRLPPQRSGDRKIVRAFVEAQGVPEGLHPGDVMDIGLKLLHSES